MMLGVALLAPASPSNAKYVIREIIDSTGDGGNTLDAPLGVALDSSGNVYETGYWTDNAFKIRSVPLVPVLSNLGLATLAASLLCIAFWVGRRRRMHESATQRST